jgi:O-methyltransferase domain
VPERPPPRLVAAAVLAARRGLRRLSDRIVPAHLAVFDASIGTGRTQVLGTIAELGVADALAGGPQTAEELASRLEVDADMLHRILRAAATEDVVRLDRDGRFSLSRLGKVLRSDHPRTMRPWTRYIASRSCTEAWAELTPSLRTGEGAFRRVHGKSVWEWFAEHPEEERVFAATMRRMTEDVAPAVVAAYPWPERGSVCDVAGGVGTLLAAVLRERPGLRGVLVDAPGVLEEAEAHLAQMGVRERVELVEGDIFGRLEARADVYLLKDVLHDWGDEACAQILGNVAATMPPGGRLVLVEALQERNEPDPIASLTDVHMLTQCEGGRQRSVAELHALLDGAGLRPGRVERTLGPALVEGIAA